MKFYLSIDIDASDHIEYPDAPTGSHPHWCEANCGYCHKLDSYADACQELDEEFYDELLQDSSTLELHNGDTVEDLALTSSCVDFALEEAEEMTHKELTDFIKRLEKIRDGKK